MSNQRERTLTANQVVAFNLQMARRLQGWTQVEAAERLEQHLGVRWSKANWSAAERSVTSKRQRQFTADEIVAFSLTFDVPVGWWFLPPSDEIPGVSESARSDFMIIQVGGEGWEFYHERLAELLAAFGPYEDVAFFAIRQTIETAMNDQASRKLRAFGKQLSDLAGIVQRITDSATSDKEN